MEIDVTEKDAETEKEKDNSPLSVLIKAAKLMNPAQFELSKDVASTTPMPGMWEKYSFGPCG